MSGILSDIKSSLGITDDVPEYDRDIILHTNSILSKLFQISGTASGVVPQIETAAQEGASTPPDVDWDQVIDAGNETAMIKSYMYLSVRLLFDPPTTSFAIKAMQDQQAEFEWRIRELEHLFVQNITPAIP